MKPFIIAMAASVVMAACAQTAREDAGAIDALREALAANAGVSDAQSAPKPDKAPDKRVEASGLILVSSPYSVEKTLDRLAMLAQARGAKVFARINHAAGAATLGADLGPMQALIFGAPKLGTPILQAAPSAAQDLPLRAAAWETQDGVVLAYPHMPSFAARHGLSPNDPAIAPVETALENLIRAAIATE